MASPSLSAAAMSPEQLAKPLSLAKITCSLQAERLTSLLLEMHGSWQRKVWCFYSGNAQPVCGTSAEDKTHALLIQNKMTSQCAGQGCELPEDMLEGP
jgi:hypothetical protein